MPASLPSCLWACPCAFPMATRRISPPEAPHSSVGASSKPTASALSTTVILATTTSGGMPVYATRETNIYKGDRVCQFRIMRRMEPVHFEEGPPSGRRRSRRLRVDRHLLISVENIFLFSRQQLHIDQYRERRDIQRLQFPHKITPYVYGAKYPQKTWALSRITVKRAIP